MTGTSVNDVFLIHQRNGAYTEEYGHYDTQMSTVNKKVTRRKDLEIVEAGQISIYFGTTTQQN